MLGLKLGQTIPVAISDDVSVPLMVCSHERSGTHFLMNYLASCTSYTSEPYLNYDLQPLGAAVNFFDPRSVRTLLSDITGVTHEGRSGCVSSILKSHYPISLIRGLLNDAIKAVYIYRNPVDVMISYWKVLHGWDWFEGPKTETPLMLAKHVPMGQSQRYQIQSCGSYLERWARHVHDAHALAQACPNLVPVNYDDLASAPEAVLERVCGALEIDMVATPERPSRDKNVIEGADLPMTQAMRDDLAAYCRERLGKVPGLPGDLRF